MSSKSLLLSLAVDQRFSFRLTQNRSVGSPEHPIGGAIGQPIF